MNKTEVELRSDLSSAYSSMICAIGEIDSFIKASSDNGDDCESLRKAREYLRYCLVQGDYRSFIST